MRYARRMFTVSVRRDGHLLVVSATGHANLGDLLGLADLVARVSSTDGIARVLIDLLGVDHQLSFTQHLSLGAHVSQVAAGLDRVATVVPLALRTGTSEKAAQKLGANLRTFTELESALQWLRA